MRRQITAVASGIRRRDRGRRGTGRRCRDHRRGESRGERVGRGEQASTAGSGCRPCRNSDGDGFTLSAVIC
jgi:hypothetical protein